MSSQLVLNKRIEQGHKVKALREAGLIPSVVYGAGEPVVASSVYKKSLMRQVITLRLSLISMVRSSSLS